MGRILFKFESDEEDHDVHFFRALEYSGEPRESDEMTVEWFHINDIPYDKMWEADKHWLPLLLEGKYFLGDVLYGEDHKIKDKDIKEFEDRESFEKALEERLAIDL